MRNRIILGSANFDHVYGVKKNIIKKNEIKKLFDLAFKKKVRIIDTSPTYNYSEKIIGLLNNNRFKIISKIPKLPKNIKKKNVQKWLNTIVNTSLKNLKIKKFECLLVHNSESLLTKNGSEIYKSIKNMKTKGLTKKIGVSIYDFDVLEKILNKFKFNLIQAPFNVLDQRLIEKERLIKLKKQKIEVHVRSIFLQGTLLLKKNLFSKKLKNLNKELIVWKDWLKKNKLNALHVCLLHVLNHKKLDGVVIGCDSKNELSEILKVQKIKNSISLAGLNIRNKNLIDPRKWVN
jgi:aryl-alcohol dehydrogenase-like predicted oxidoreductase